MNGQRDHQQQILRTLGDSCVMLVNPKEMFRFDGATNGDSAIFTVGDPAYEKVSDLLEDMVLIYDAQSCCEVEYSTRLKYTVVQE